MAPLASKELRVQLEGAWEVLERAREELRRLRRRLRSERWVEHLRRDPGLPRRVCALAAPLAQALERAERRLRQEGESECVPLRELLHSLKGEGEALEVFVRQRLRFWDERGTGALWEDLERLAVRVEGPADQLPGEAEPVLLTGGPQRVWMGSPLLAALYSWLPIHPWSMLVRVGVFALLLGVVHLGLAFRRRHSRFWRTPRRLVWRTRLGEVEQLRLSPSEPLPKGPGWLLPGMRNTAGLDAVAFLHGMPPLQGRELRVPPSAPCVLPALHFPRGIGLFMPLPPASGLLVIRPGRLFFLDNRGLAAFLEAVSGVLFLEHVPALSLAMLVQHLQLLPEAEFVRCLEQAVHAGAGTSWPTSAVKAHGRTLLGRHTFVLPEGVRLLGRPTSAQRELLHRLLQGGGHTPG